MGFKCGNVPIVSNPTGIDKIVTDIQQALAQISWLEYSFGRAYRRKTTRSGEDYHAPFVYNKGREYIDVDPQDDVKAFSFIEVNESKDISNYTPINKSWNQSQEVDVIVFANLELIDNTIDGIFTEKLIDEVNFILNSVSSIYRINSVEEGLDNAYSKYDYKDDWIKMNYGAFKVKCTTIAPNECFQGNNFTTTTC